MFGKEASPIISKLKNENLALTAFVAMMALMLNHTVRAAGFNLSISDILLLIIGTYLALLSSLYIPKFGFIYLSLLISITLFSTLLVTPLVFDVQPLMRAVISDLVKVLVSFSYFVVGYSIARVNLHLVALKWFSFGAFAIALLGLVMELFGIGLFRSLFFYGDLRFQGFMTDPNFYSILACAAIAYFSFAPVKVRGLRPFAIFVLASSVVISGSKTGLLTFGALVLIVFLTYVKRTKNLLPIGFLALGLVLLILNRLKLAELAQKYAEQIPQLDRISVLLSTNPANALSAGGSAREDSWMQGISLIQDSPIFGVGLGTYAEITSKVFGSRTLAHNTYIQIAAEWGFVLMAVLFLWIGYLLVVSLKSSLVSHSTFELAITRSMIVVFLIGSITLSLNNARMLWLFLGIFAFLVHEGMRLDRNVVNSESVRSDKSSAL